MRTHLRDRASFVAILTLASIRCGNDVHEIGRDFPVPCVCDDDDPCTDDFCQEDGTCLSAPAEVTRACLNDRHCDVPTSCTVGSCEPYEGCGFSRCTLEVRDCDDHDPCTVDHCEEGRGCIFERLDVGNSCEADSECDDGSACTDDTCEAFPGCGRFCRNTPNDCRPCTTAVDCGFACQASSCVDGACTYGPEEPRCDYNCFNPSSTTPDMDDVGSGFRGVAVPVDDDCTGCTCRRDLVLRGEHRDLTLRQGASVDGAAWGTCDVDLCGGDTGCAPLLAGRGYFLSGGSWLASEFVDGRWVGPFTLQVDYYCLATHSNLMLGRWRMTLKLEGGESTSFDATVVETDSGPTRFEIPGTIGNIGVPSQTLFLPNGGFRLETSLTTARGDFSGALFSGPTAIEGDVQSKDGLRAVLRIEPTK